MKKINATATITKEVIAEITITDEDKKLLGTSGWLIAMKYMETNFPGMDDGNGKRILFLMMSQTLLVIG